MTTFDFKPVFIIGMGRSGSSIFHQIFARHSAVSWMSKWLDDYPDHPEFNRYLMQALSTPVLGPWLQRRTSPEECYGFWNYLSPGFRSPYRDLIAGDVTVRSRERVRTAMKQIVSANRPCLVVKITGWPRTGFLKECFPDARFIYVRRNIESIASSLLNVDWWRGWQGPGAWRWGPLPEDCRSVWQEVEESFVGLAAIQCIIIKRAIDSALSQLSPDSVLKVDYESLCRNPDQEFERVLGFCELPFTNQFQQHVSEFHLSSTRSKWRANLTSEQQHILEHVISRLEKNE